MSKRRPRGRTVKPLPKEHGVFRSLTPATEDELQPIFDRAQPVRWYAQVTSETELGRVGYVGIQTAPKSSGRMAMVYDIDRHLIAFAVDGTDAVYGLALDAEEHLAIARSLTTCDTVVFMTTAAPLDGRTPVPTPRNAFWAPWNSQLRAHLLSLLASAPKAN